MRFGGRLRVMAEGVGFEPTVGITPRSISSRVPSTGLSHPSFKKLVIYRIPKPSKVKESMIVN